MWSFTYTDAFQERERPGSLLRGLARSRTRGKEHKLWHSSNLPHDLPSYFSLGKGNSEKTERLYREGNNSCLRPQGGVLNAPSPLGSELRIEKQKNGVRNAHRQMLGIEARVSSIQRLPRSRFRQNQGSRFLLYASCMEPLSKNTGGKKNSFAGPRRGSGHPHTLWNPV